MAVTDDYIRQLEERYNQTRDMDDWRRLRDARDQQAEEKVRGQRLDTAEKDKKTALTSADEAQLERYLGAKELYRLPDGRLVDSQDLEMIKRGIDVRYGDKLQQLLDANGSGRTKKGFEMNLAPPGSDPLLVGPRPSPFGQYSYLTGPEPQAYEREWNNLRKTEGYDILQGRADAEKAARDKAALDAFTAEQNAKMEARKKAAQQAHDTGEGLYKAPDFTKANTNPYLDVANDYESYSGLKNKTGQYDSRLDGQYAYGEQYDPNAPWKGIKQTLYVDPRFQYSYDPATGKSEIADYVPGGEAETKFLSYDPTFGAASTGVDGASITSDFPTISAYLNANQGRDLQGVTKDVAESQAKNFQDLTYGARAQDQARGKLAYDVKTGDLGSVYGTLRDTYNTNAGETGLDTAIMSKAGSKDLAYSATDHNYLAQPGMRDPTTGKVLGQDYQDLVGRVNREASQSAGPSETTGRTSRPGQTTTNGEWRFRNGRMQWVPD